VPGKRRRRRRPEREEAQAIGAGGVPAIGDAQMERELSRIMDWAKGVRAYRMSADLSKEERAEANRVCAILLNAIALAVRRHNVRHPDLDGTIPQRYSLDATELAWEGAEAVSPEEVRKHVLAANKATVMYAPVRRLRRELARRVGT
jgi:hypothetical protein